MLQTSLLIHIQAYAVNTLHFLSINYSFSYRFPLKSITFTRRLVGRTLSQTSNNGSLELEGCSWKPRNMHTSTIFMPVVVSLKHLFSRYLTEQTMAIDSGNSLWWLNWVCRSMLERKAFWVGCVWIHPKLINPFSTATWVTAS